MKPSEINVIKAKKGILFKNFDALTWKGTVYCTDSKIIESLNAHNYIDSNLKCHETIHVRQAESIKDSWFRFYLLYILQWILNFPLFIYGWIMPYYFISFELEAYVNQNDYSYVQNGAVYEWKKYNSLSIKEKLNLAKEFQKNNSIGFPIFARIFIKPLIKQT